MTRLISSSKIFRGGGSGHMQAEHGTDIFSLKRKYIIISLIIFLFVLISLFVYARNLNSTLQQNSLNRFIELADYNKTVIHSGIEDKQIKLHNIATYLETANYIDPESIKTFQNNNGIEHIGIIDTNGNVQMLDHEGELNWQAERQAFYLKGLKGQDIITKLNNCLIISTPLKKQDKIMGVLFAVYKAENINDLISFKDEQNLNATGIFKGSGYSLIVDRQGNKVLDSSNALKLKIESGNAFINLNKFSATNKNSVEKLRQDMNKNQSGGMHFQSELGTVYLYYQPLDINDLYLINAIPEDVLTEQFNGLMVSTYILFACMLLIVVFIISMIVKSERRKREELRYLVEVEELTGGYSYEKFICEVPKWLQRPTKQACIAMDIDNFKLINTIFGYEIGNKVLKEIWQIIIENIGQKGICTKRYADVYDILVEYETREDLEALVEKIDDDVTHITTINKDKFRIIPSIGIYLLENKHEDIKSILNCASIARNSIKNMNNIHYAFYSHSLKADVIEKKSLIDDILRALREQEFWPYFQPQFDAKTKQLVGAEALIRWIKPDGTIVSPAKFIPIAEEVGSIVNIDKYMLDAVCKWQYYWQSIGKKIVPISINVSRSSLYRPNIVEEYVKILQEYKLSPKYIQIEITEGILCGEWSINGNIVNQLRKAGFDVLIDDFGVGYSSISMVKDIEATDLKVDKSFIDDMSQKGKAMIKHVIDLSKTMKMKTIAEGVETKEQYEFLRDNNCDIIQGYYFAKPLPSSEFVKLLADK